MTALHLLAQELLKGDKVVNLKEGKISYLNGVTEFKFPDSGLRFDVAGIKPDQAIFIIEIRVTHEVDETKIKFLEEMKLHSIEIDLRQVDPDIGKEALLNFLLNDVSNQRVIYSPIDDKVVEHDDQPKTKSTPSEWSWFELLLIGVGITWAGYKIKKLFQAKK